jgi:hypothetical protein
MRGIFTCFPQGSRPRIRAATIVANITRPAEVGPNSQILYQHELVSIL